MAFDAFDLAWLDILMARRLIIPFAVGIAAGCGFYYLSGQGPSSAAVAFGMAIAGFIVGVIWHIAGGKHSGSA